MNFVPKEFLHKKKNNSEKKREHSHTLTLQAQKVLIQLKHKTKQEKKIFITHIGTRRQIEEIQHYFVHGCSGIFSIFYRRDGGSAARGKFSLFLFLHMICICSHCIHEEKNTLQQQQKGEKKRSVHFLQL